MSQKMYKIAKWMSITGMCILFISAFINFWWGKADMQSINTQFGFTLVAIGLAACAISLAFSSDEKMIALTNLNFTEKHAMMQTYIQDFNNRAEQCKLDFEAAIEVKEWASPEKKKEYIEDLIKLINTRLETHIQEQNIRTVEEILISMIDKAIASKMTTKTQTTTLTDKREELSKYKKKIS